jgi:hypothetical protein
MYCSQKVWDCKKNLLCNLSRVTRLGEVSPSGQLFSLGRFWKLLYIYTKHLPLQDPPNFTQIGILFENIPHSKPRTVRTVRQYINIALKRAKVYNSRFRRKHFSLKYDRAHGGRLANFYARFYGHEKKIFFTASKKFFNRCETTVWRERYAGKTSESRVTRLGECSTIGLFWGIYINRPKKFGYSFRRKVMYICRYSPGGVAQLTSQLASETADPGSNPVSV